VSIRAIVALLCLLGGAIGSLLPAVAAPQGGEVVVVPIHGTIDDGTARLVTRAVREAEERHARALVLDVDSSAGLPDAAMQIRDALLDAGIPVDAYVERAWSSGALVALAADRIVMSPSGSLGEAASLGAARDAVVATALRHHRDPRLASAMVDGTVEVPVFKEPGRVLALTAEQARASGFSETTASSLGDALAAFGLDGTPAVVAPYDPPDRIARIATNPTVSGLLLALGFIGLLVELQTLHLVAGALGAAALALFFAVHVYAGFSSGFVVALALAAVLLILVELHVFPGHGLAGAAGVAALVAAVLLAFGIPFLVVALQALAIAIVLSAAAFALLQRVLPENAFVHRLMFAGAQGSDYVASADYRSLLGQSGTAVSFLRPAGVASFDDRRVDVLSEGDFVPAGTPVRVTRVEGARIFVKPERE
jgi:membrane-bound serine protease (ClpP class)